MTPYRLAPNSTPNTPIVSLADTKSWLRITHSQEDALLQRLVSTAAEQVESMTLRAGAERQYIQTFDDFPDTDDFLEIGRGPLSTSEAKAPTLKYYSATNVLTTLSGTEWASDNTSRVLLPRARLAYQKAWPVCRGSPGGVVITFYAGYVAVDTIPAPYIQAALLYVGYLYENRDAAVGQSAGTPLDSVLRAMKSILEPVTFKHI